LTENAISLVALLHGEFEGHRVELLDRRRDRWAELKAGIRPRFRAHSRASLDDDWRAPPAPSGVGAVAIHNLMEDVATPEIARAQVWQWVRHAVRLDDGTRVSIELVRVLLEHALQAIRLQTGEAKAQLAGELFEHVSLSGEFVEVLAISAYEHID
jgi:malate synthase